MKARHHAALATTSILCWLAGCSSGGYEVVDTAAGQVNPIVVECAAGSGTDWGCPQNLTLDCKDLATATFEVKSPASLMCEADALSISYAEPLTPGKHTVALRDAMDRTLCTSEVTITQSTKTKLVPKTVQLWPPNHKLHEIAVSDCVDIVDACPGDDLHPEFVWASSDEPVNDLGDGNHAPDILLADDCERVSLRAERQGPKNGRVYKLGVRMQDRAGNVAEATCEVIVDHDQRGLKGADSGEAYRVLFDGKNGVPECTGNPPPPPPTTPPTPPQNPPPAEPPAANPPPASEPGEDLPS